MAKRAAIILAGGKAQRFQTAQGELMDKALAELYKKPLLVHVVENVQDIVDEVIVVVNENQNRKSLYSYVLARYHINGVQIITDLKINQLSGPIIAILTGLQSASAEYCLTVPCDMPLLSKKVADYLFDEINGSYVAVPMWPNGRLETLLMTLERTKTLEITNVLCQLGRSHPDDIIRAALHVLFVSPLGKIKVLDSELRSFVNINSQEDLSRLQPRQGQGAVVENLRLNLGTLPAETLQLLLKATSKRDNSDFLGAATIFSDCALKFEKENLFFWSALSREYEGKSLLALYKQCDKPEPLNSVESAILKAAKNYGLEAKTYEENSCYFLAERAKADRAWCESQIKSFK
jgi:molybdopterin-guanine dinucleotide biosynthesis protein A